MVCPCLSWGVNYYKIIFLLFKVIIHISERTFIIWEISGDAASFRKTKLLVQLGREGVPLEITVGVCSLFLKAQAYLRQKHVICSPLCQLSRNIPYSRALFQKGQAYSVSLHIGVKSHTLYNLSGAILQYRAYIR